MGFTAIPGLAIRGSLVSSVRSTRRVWIWLIFPLIAILLGQLGLVWSGAFGFMILPWVLIVAYRIRSLVCPKCSVPLGKHTVSVAGIELAWYSLFVPRFCQHCGRDLDVP
jgi:hypothetical protein